MPSMQSFSPIVGDFLNNLRETLDCWISIAVKQSGLTTKDNIGFPFGDKYKEHLNKIWPQLTTFIQREIKLGKKSVLFRLNKLSRTNKHRSLVPVSGKCRLEITSATVGNVRFENFTFESAPSKGGKECIVRSMNASFDESSQYSMSAEIIFPKEYEFYGGKPIIPVLEEMYKEVSVTINKLDEFYELSQKCGGINP